MTNVFILSVSFLWANIRYVFFCLVSPGYVAEICLYTIAGLNLRDRVLGEVERNSFIALPGKLGHSGLVPSRLCVPPWREQEGVL